MKKIIFDTNFAIIPFQFKVDIYSELSRVIDEEYEMYFLNAATSELEKLKFGKAALELMKQKGVRFVDFPIKNGIDNTILEFAKKENAIIATQDKELKRKASKEGLRTITLRQKKFLILA
ncbi:MAG: nucleotide-binding protein [Nanoarchaeota archaeon]|nr:nucleotide-binding protein [Nanoarchaeota archaeon]